MEQHKVDLSKYRLEKAKKHLISAKDLLMQEQPWH